MILYHTSNMEIRKPDIAFSRSSLDFGRGFYTTENKSQAEKYARRFFKQNEPAVMNIYSFDDSDLEGKFDDEGDSFSHENKAKEDASISKAQKNIQEQKVKEDEEKNDKDTDKKKQEAEKPKESSNGVKSPIKENNSDEEED